MAWLLSAAAAAAVAVAGYLVVPKLLARRGTPRREMAPCPASLAWLCELPLRRRALPRTLDAVGVRAGERVLELGPGPGVFTVEAARRVGPAGRVVAVDVQLAMAERALKRVRSHGVDAALVVGDGAALPLADASLDRAFLVAVLGELPDQVRALSEISRVLRPGGVLAICEEFVAPDYLFASEVVRRATAAGFVPAGQHGGLWRYTATFRKPERPPTDRPASVPREGRRHAATPASSSTGRRGHWSTGADPVRTGRPGQCPPCPGVCPGCAGGGVLPGGQLTRGLKSANRPLGLSTNQTCSA